MQTGSLKVRSTKLSSRAMADVQNIVKSEESIGDSTFKFFVELVQ